MTHLPNSKSAFKKRWPQFEKWLLERGSAILAPTNPYEIARFITNVGTGVVYVNGKDNITSWVNGAAEAYQAFLSNQPWRAVDRINRSKKTRRDYEALVARDGCGCMYCDVPLSLDEATIEHVVPITSGGTNHLANKALACDPHNKAAGHMSAREKLEFAIRIRTGAAA